MFNQTTMISVLFIGFIAAILFVYVQQKTSRIEKNIKNVISFIKDIEKRIEEKKQDVSNEFISVKQNVVEAEAEAEAEAESESDSEAEAEAEEEEEEEKLGIESESNLDEEIVNIKFNVNEEDYKKKTVAQLREIVISMNIDVQDIHKLKKKEIIEILENYYTGASDNDNDSDKNNINI